MLLQTNSYIVPKDKRADHARLMRRFRQILNRIGCDSFEVYEQVGANWAATQTTGRFVQIMRFRDRKHQLAVQNAERSDPAAQQLIAEFCELVNYPLQQQQQQFAVGFYSSVLPVAPVRSPQAEATSEQQPGEMQHEPAAVPTSLVGDSSQPEMQAVPVDEDEPAPQAQATTDTVPDAIAAPAEQQQEQWQEVSRPPDTDQPHQEDLAVEPVAEEDELVATSEPAPAPESQPLGDASPVIEPTQALTDNAPPAPSEAAGDLSTESLSEDDLLGVVSTEPAPAAEPHPHDTPANGDAELLSDDLGLGADDNHDGDDDISRLAEELAAETDQHHTGHPGAHPEARPSENGAR
jgi:hypothetical protein